MAREIYDSYEDKQTDDVPEELRQMLEALQIDKMERIEKLGKAVAKKRDEAVTARKQSGIERIWREDEEYYLGIDDANRSTSAWIKPAGDYGGLSRDTKVDAGRCTAFFNITAQFCDAASARMGDILLPAGDWNFVVKPTPVIDDPAADYGPQPEGLSPADNPFADVPKMQELAKDQTLARQQEVDKKVEKAEERIKDWLTECSYHSEVRKVLEDCVVVGTGVLKGPVPHRSKAMKISEDENGDTQVDFETKIAPISVRVEPHNFFPDPACGENIHYGNYVFERQELTARQLRELIGTPGYQKEQIEQVLKEGPGRKYVDDGLRISDGVVNDSDRFEVWHFYGMVDLEALTAMGIEDCAGKDDVPACVTLVNERAIKAFLNPLDTGGFPYDVIPWQQMAGVPWGAGIARKGRVPQEMLNASMRAMMDNAGLGSRPMWVARQGAVRPVDGNWTLQAGKGFIATEQADVRSVADAITFINVPMMQNELNAIVELAYKMMEDSTGVAFLLQGQQGAAPDTVGGMELLNRNASAVLRRMARTFDERITEPHIRRYYTYLMQYGEDSEKSDLVIEAVGSSALVEREIQALELQQLLAASVNPAFELSPSRTMTELLKIKRMSPEKFQLDESEKQRMQQQPQTIPVIEVAKIRAESAEKIADLEAKIETYKAKINAETVRHKVSVDQDRDTAYNQSLANRDQTTAQIRIEELKLKRELALLDRETKMLDYSNRREINLDQVKAELAKTSLQLRTQKELAGVTKKAVQVAETQMEPVGKAPSGEAFQA
jgi:hypothetical protein